MREALAKTDSNKLSFGHFKCILASGKFQRHGNIFQRCHIGNEVEGLEDDPDIGTAECRGLILGHLADCLACNLHTSVIDMLKTSQNHQKGRLTRTRWTYDADGPSLGN